MIQSPLYRLLPQILPLFPKEIDLFVDLFCGGCNVGVNVEANRFIYNDINRNLLCIYQAFQCLGKEKTRELIYEIIKPREWYEACIKKNEFFLIEK